jgi:hypothetical protein
MAQKILKALAALALVASPLPAFAQTTDAPASTSQGPQGAGLWIGIFMTAAVLALIFAHDEIFGDSNDEPASP